MLSAIRAFTDHIGVAKTNSTVDIELLESFVRTELNETALRRMVVLRPIKVVITNWPDGHQVEVEAVNNPQDDSAGTRPVAFGGELWIEADDFKLEPPPKYYRLTPGREVRLRAGYYITATGHPAISVPCGFTSDGLPVGVQIVGRYRDDWGVLQLAYAFQEATQVWKRRPPMCEPEDDQ